MTLLFQEPVYIDLTVDDNVNESAEEDIENMDQSPSKSDESSLMELFSDNDSLASIPNHNGIDPCYVILMNSG